MLLQLIADRPAHPGHKTLDIAHGNTPRPVTHRTRRRNSGRSGEESPWRYGTIQSP